MSELKRCMCCGVSQGNVDEHNDEYQRLVAMLLDCGDERQLLALIDLMRAKVITGVKTSIGDYKLAYPERELYHINVIRQAAAIISDKLKSR